MGQPSAKGTYKPVVSTFKKVDGSAMTIKDLTPSATAGTLGYSTFYVIPWNGGNPMKVKDDTWIQDNYASKVTAWANKDVHFYYFPTDKKWYLTDDYRSRTCDMSDYPLSQVQGVTMYVGNLANGATLTFSGEVEKEDIPAVGAKGTYNMTGNIAPVDLTIKDFIPSCTAGTLGYSTFYVIPWNGGNPMKVKDDAWIQEKYASKVTAWANKDVHLYYFPTDKKWYLTDDYRSRTCDMSDYPIKAGQGFTLYVGNLANGAQLLLPSAL